MSTATMSAGNGCRAANLALPVEASCHNACIMAAVCQSRHLLSPQTSGAVLWGDRTTFLQKAALHPTKIKMHPNAFKSRGSDELTDITHMLPN